MTNMAANGLPMWSGGWAETPGESQGPLLRGCVFAKRNESRSISRTNESTVDCYLLGLAGRRTFLFPHVTMEQVPSLGKGSVLGWAVEFNQFCASLAPPLFPEQDFRTKNPCRFLFSDAKVRTTL